MSWGIRIRGNGFQTQIDHNFKNYGFLQIIPVTVTMTFPSVPEQGLVQVTVPGLNSLVGVRCEQFFYFPLGSYFDGTNWLYTFKFFPEFVATGTFSETVKFYVFNTLEVGALPNVGIRIRHPVTGELVFHSAMRPLNMVAKTPCTAAFYGDPARLFCPIVTRFCFINNFYAGVGYRLEPYGLRCVGSTIGVKQYSLPANYAGFFTYFDAGEYAAIDVTGL